MKLCELFVHIFFHFLSGRYGSGTGCIICTYFVCILPVVSTEVDPCAVFVHILSVFYMC